MEELGQTPPPLEEAPDALEDFPPLVGISIEIYNKLQDRLIADAERIILLGKDFTNFEQVCQLYYVESREEKQVVYELLLLIDSVNVKRANRKR